MTTPDPMAQAAQIAAQHATALGFHLHGAGCSESDRSERAVQLRKALGHWAPLIRAMSALGLVSPVASTQAEADDQRLSDWMAERTA